MSLEHIRPALAPAAALALCLAALSPAAAASKKAKASPGGVETSEDAARTVPSGASKGVKACHADIEKFCKKVKPGESRLGLCLQNHVAELSRPCRAWASHGGAGHETESLLDIDRGPAQKPTPESREKADGSGVHAPREP